MRDAACSWVRPLSRGQAALKFIGVCMTRSFSIGRDGALAGAGKSNPDGAGACTASGNALHHYDPIALVARKLWPAKTAEHLADYLGCSLRNAKYFLSPGADRKAMRIEFLRNLLFGQYGHEFLKAWMDESDAEWWQRLVDLERKQIENEEALRTIRKAIEGS